MHDRGRAWLKVVVRIAVLVATLACGAPARAAGVDDAVTSSVDKVLADDFANANYGEARRKLRALADKCKKQTCAPATLAGLHRALGMVSAQIGQKEDAKKEFLQVLDADPMSRPLDGATDAIKAAWADAQKVWDEAHPQDEATKAGWQSNHAYELAKAALEAEAAEKFGDCIDKERGALTLEEHASARLHLVACEAKSGKVIDALRDAQKALEAAAAEHDDASAKAAQARIEELLPRVAHVQFDPPAGVSDLKLTFDDKAVPAERIAGKFSIDPGHHHVQAEGTVRGTVLTFDQQYDVTDGQVLVVKLTLKPTLLTPGQLGCMLAAKTQEDVLKCVPQQQKQLVAHVGIDVGAYGDTTHVNVLTPAIHGSVTSPTAGWNIGATYLVDVVSAASPDIVSEASPPYHEVRQAATATGGYKPGRFGAQASAYYSTEPDYLSRGAGLALSGDFNDKLVTPLVSYSYGQDTIGRTGTPFSVFSHSLMTNEILAGATLVLTKSSILVLAGTTQIETGDQSKPYRYVPMFAPGTTVPVGASTDQVNAARLFVRPLEQLPLSRDRFALAARYVSRSGNATLRLDERVYADTWNVYASTTDLRYIIDTGHRLEVWPHVHLHAQTGASFYQRVYNALVRPDGTILLPAYRTDDRELSPFTSLTLGGGARLALARPESKIQYGFTAQADALGSVYYDTLFIRARLAVYGSLGFDVEFQ